MVATVVPMTTTLRATLEVSLDLVVLDVMLPRLNGFEALKRIRERSSVPVIMLAARVEAVDRIVGLELGADDYLPKPFEPRELLARIKSVLRRKKTPGLDQLFETAGLLGVEFKICEMSMDLMGFQRAEMIARLRVSQEVGAATIAAHLRA